MNKQLPRAIDNRIKLENIVIPDWYPRKYVSKQEVDRAIKLIQDKTLGCIPISVRNLRESSQYELFEGIITYKAHKALNHEEVYAGIYDEEAVSKADAMLASASRNTRRPLNPWESTYKTLQYLEETLDFRREDMEVEIFDTATASYWTKKISTETAILNKLHAILICKTKSKAANKDKASIEPERFKKLKRRFTDQDEAHVDAILNATNVSLDTFLNKRSKLFRLPSNIIRSLNNGEINYSQAIAISSIGLPEEFDHFRDYYNDRNIAIAIANEQDDLLKMAVEDRLNAKQIGLFIKDAQTRIGVICSSFDSLRLSDSEIEKRIATRNDLTQQNNCSDMLKDSQKTLKNWDFFSKMTEKDKSRVQRRTSKYNEFLSELEVKYAIIEANKKANKKARLKLAVDTNSR